MANRKGTYLSDENVKARCPENFPVPLGKAYALFTLSDGTPGQRPQNVLQALREMARNQNRPYQDLERLYKNNLALAKNELVVAIPQFSRNTTQVASIALQGNGGVQAQGVPVSNVAPVVNIGTQAGEAKIDYTAILKELGRPPQEIQKKIYKDLYEEAKASGVDVTLFSASNMNNSMSRKKRDDLFKRLLEQTNIIQPDDVASVIYVNTPSASYTPMRMTPIPVSPITPGS